MVTEAARGWDDEGFLNVSGLCNIVEYSALLIWRGVPNQRRTHSSQKPDIYDLMVTDIFIVSPGRKIKFCDSSVFRNYKNSIEAELFEVDRIVVASPGKLTQMK
jgi:hypothetical protein